MNDLTLNLRNALLTQGADLVAFGALTQLPPEQRYGLPTGISVAVKYEKNTIRGIRKFPTQAYLDQYHQLNHQLDTLVTFGAQMLTHLGYQATALTGAFVAKTETDLATLLPHKTVATRAGLGWIGKCALLITNEYGSMVRISSIVTDAPLDTAAPIDASKCGSCIACMRACPAGAVKGVNWQLGAPREDFFDPALCRQVARERAQKALGVEITQCGRCIEACPYTRRYLERGL